MDRIVAYTVHVLNPQSSAWLCLDMVPLYAQLKSWSHIINILSGRQWQGGRDCDRDRFLVFWFISPISETARTGPSQSQELRTQSSSLTWKQISKQMVLPVATQHAHWQEARTGNRTGTRHSGLGWGRLQECLTSGPSLQDWLVSFTEETLQGSLSTSVSDIAGRWAVWKPGKEPGGTWSWGLVTCREN